MTRHPGLIGAILAGGRATRMGGADKTLLRVGGDPADTTLRRILDVFAGRFPACVIVSGTLPPASPPRRPDLSVTVTRDRVEGCGPLGGLDAALRAATAPAVFVCGCDMPRLSGPLIDLMAGRMVAGRALVPVHRGRPEPLHAIYPASCLPEVERALEEGIRMMLDFLERIPADYLPEADYAGIEEAGLSFTNINTPADLERART